MRRRFLDVLFPRQCLLCADQALAHNLCAACFDELPRNAPCCACCARPLPQPLRLCGACQAQPPLFDQLYAPYRYAVPLDYLIKRYKFNKQFAVLPLLARLCLGVLREMDPSPDQLVPMPLHWTRLLARGFNQSEQLASALGRATGTIVSHKSLHRRRRTKAQSLLDHEQRLANVEQVFEAREELCSGKRILLIDDIATTGATAESACEALRSAGAATLDVLVVARA